MVAYQKAAILYNSFRYLDCLRQLSTLLQIDPIHLRGLVLLVQCHIKLDELDKAKIAIDAAISNYPNHPLVLLNFGHWCYASKKYEEAILYADRAIEANPIDANLWQFRGACNYNLRHFKSALKDVDKALSIDPNNVFVLNLKSLILDQQNSSIQAFETAQLSLANDPNNAFSHATLAGNYLKIRDYNKGFDHAVEAVRINPNDDYALATLKEAMRCKYPFYRPIAFLRNWIVKQTERSRTRLINAVFIFVFLVGAVSLGLGYGLNLLIPVLFAIIFSWIYFGYSISVSTILLSRDKRGKALVTNEQKMVAFLRLFFLILMTVSLAGFLIFSLKYLAVVYITFSCTYISVKSIFKMYDFPHFYKMLSLVLFATSIAAIKYSYFHNSFMSPYIYFVLLEFIIYISVRRVSDSIG